MGVQSPTSKRASKDARTLKRKKKCISARLGAFAKKRFILGQRKERDLRGIPGRRWPCKARWGPSPGVVPRRPNGQEGLAFPGTRVEGGRGATPPHPERTAAPRPCFLRQSGGGWEPLLLHLLLRVCVFQHPERRRLLSPSGFDETSPVVVRGSGRLRGRPRPARLTRLGASGHGALPEAASRPDSGAGGRAGGCARRGSTASRKGRSAQTQSGGRRHGVGRGRGRDVTTAPRR